MSETAACPVMLDIDGLAAVLLYKPATIRTLIYQHPDQLPPRIRGMAKPLWHPAVVNTWLIDQSRPERAKTGRKRGVN